MDGEATIRSVLEIKPTVLQFTEILGLGSDSEAIRFNLQRT